MIILPRQARDKHRAKSTKHRLLAAGSAALGSRAPVLGRAQAGGEGRAGGGERHGHAAAGGSGTAPSMGLAACAGEIEFQILCFLHCPSLAKNNHGLPTQARDRWKATRHV
jgi:hypothetical protein